MIPRVCTPAESVAIWPEQNTCTRPPQSRTSRSRKRPRSSWRMIFSSWRKAPRTVPDFEAEAKVVVKRLSDRTSKVSSTCRLSVGHIFKPLRRLAFEIDARTDHDLSEIHEARDVKRPAKIIPFLVANDRLQGGSRSPLRCNVDSWPTPQSGHELLHCEITTNGPRRGLPSCLPISLTKTTCTRIVQPLLHPYMRSPSRKTHEGASGY